MYLFLHTIYHSLALIFLSYTNYQKNKGDNMVKKFIVICYEVHNLGVKDLKEFTNKESTQLILCKKRKNFM